MDALPPLGALGWRGVHTYDSPEVVELRTQMRDLGGIAGLELVDPATPGFAAQAAALFHRDGFVLVRDALTAERTERIKEGVDAVIRGMVERDPRRLGSRGSHRYAFANAPAHFGRCGAWAALIDNPIALTVLEAIFESPGFCCSGTGGDYVLPGAVEFQHLHRDMGDFLHDPSGRRDFLDMPCPQVVVNYPMIVSPEPREVTTFSGATRQIAGTQRSHQPVPPEADEPMWMKCAITAPAPPGCALFRDVRAWHGGTPNLTLDDVRAIPSATYCAPWFAPEMATGYRPRSLPRSVYETLSPRGREIARLLACEVRKRISFAPFSTENDHFTKTGSGQTHGKPKK